MLSAMDLHQRLIDFDASLSSFKPTDRPSSQTQDIFNALLKVAQEQFADDPIIQAIKPGGADMAGRGTMDVGSMRAAVGQIMSELDSTSGSGPAIRLS